MTVTLFVLEMLFVSFQIFRIKHVLIMQLKNKVTLKKAYIPHLQMQCKAS